MPEKTTTRKTPAIGDSLLNLLAENGKHFTGLKDDERVTIAVTFRSGSHPTPTATKVPARGSSNQTEMR